MCVYMTEAAWAPKLGWNELHAGSESAQYSPSEESSPSSLSVSGFTAEADPLDCTDAEEALAERDLPRLTFCVVDEVALGDSACHY